MMRHGKRLLALTLLPLLSGPALAQTAPAEPTAEATPASPAEAPGHALDVDVTTGARLTDVTGSREKFAEYREPDEGLVLDLRARYSRPEGGHFLEFAMENPEQSDESYRLAIGRRGAYRLSLAYDAIPHRYASGVFLWGGFGTGTLRVPDVVQRGLEAEFPLATAYGAQPGAATAPFPDPNPVPPVAGDVAQRAIVNDLYGAADGVSFGLQRRAFGAALEVNLGSSAHAWARVRNENRTGTRILGTGTYERWFDFGGTDARHSRDLFNALGAEVAEPLDDRTLGLSVGAGVQGRSWLADVEYSLTQFRNFEEVLLFDNPFRATSAESTGPLTATGGGGAVNRGRSALGNVSLAQDSLAHDVTASGAVDLPLHGRLAASLSAGLVTQDQAFQPYTRNIAIDTAVDAATDVVTAPAATLPLPQRDLNGDLRTLSGNLSASIRPLQPLRLTARYRAYRFDNRSDEITFPGYAAFGDSFWRTKRNDPSPIGGFTNEVFDYWRHEADLEADYRLTRMISLSIGGGWEGWRFDHLRLDKLDEYAIGAGVSLRPMRNASLSASYRFADRTNDGYLRGNTPENPEARGLLNYNWADRRRHLAQVRVQYAPAALLSIGLLGSFVDDSYGGETEGGTVADEFRFGRDEARRWLGSANVTVTPAERLSFNATYTFERGEETMRNAAKDNPIKAADDFGFEESFAPENYWTSDIEELVNTLGVGATFDVLPGRLALDAGYSLSFGDVDVDTRNPNPIVTDPASPTLANAVAQDWPTIEHRLHEVYADLAYRFTPRVRAGVRYLFSSYDLDDFAWDIQQPYMADVSVENTTRYLFTGATYGGYEAHLGTVYVAGSF
jgi:MtrB/PioB family decaheme-associated outer membrane protein